MDRGSVQARGGRAAAWCLAGLMLLLPFEPRRPLLHLLGFEVTLLELATALVGPVLLWLGRHRIPSLLRRPPRPLLFLSLYAAAHVLSSALAVAHRDLALKFSLRMIAMAGIGLVVALQPPEAHRRGLVALVVAASLVALLAVVEGSGLGSLDPLLNRFREMPFNVGGSRRASAGSEYPNLAAAFLMYGLLAGVALAARGSRPVGAVVALSALLVGGLLFTYSRGALVATGLGLASLLAVPGWREKRLARIPLTAMTVLVVFSAAFASAGEIFRLRLGSEGTASWYGAVYAPEENSLSLSPGETRVTAVRVTNAGLKTWTVGGAFHLSYHWFAADRSSIVDGGRTVLPRDLAHGESLLLHPEVRAPGKEGRYLLVWDMVHEHTAWFSGAGVTPEAVPVVVSRAREAASAVQPTPAALVTPPLAWRPGRGVLWRLALGMWRDRPWTGVGSDNFRWLHGPRAGRTFWDSRVFANNTLLEAGATTGTLGFLSLAGTLVSAAVVSFRRAAAAVPGSETAVVAGAQLALVAGVAAHGVVDYVLAFTGHYLAFAFIVGAIASPSAEAAA